MASNSSSATMVAALGRHFSLGKLYDARQDALIPSMTLWGRDDLENHVITKKKSYNDIQVSISETISQKITSLSIGLSLEASFLFGLVHVSGSANYLHNTKKTRRQARVTLKYEGTTEFKELSMEHLGRVNIKYPEIFEKGVATHVVTGILYGARAFFVFDCDVTEKESQQEYENTFSGILRNISDKILQGDGSTQSTYEDRIVNEFSCKYQGDFLLKKTPTCLQDVVEVYQDLPTMLQESAIPLKVWMVPLASLDSSAAKLLRELSASLVEESQRVMVYFLELEVRCNDLLRSMKQDFSQISKQLKEFRKICTQFKKNLQQTLGKKLPLIRGGEEEESVLLDILEKMKSSPFNGKTMNEWLEQKEREVDIVMFFSSLMKNTRSVTSQAELYKEVLSVEHAVCFVFTSLESNEPYLAALSTYVHVKTSRGDFHELQAPPGAELERWYVSDPVLEDMRTKVKLFSDFAEANKENKNVKFLSASLIDEKHKGSSIYLYKDGFTVSEDFQPPSQPESVTVEDINHNSVTLKVSAPRYGGDIITSYSVEFSVRGEDGWKQKTEAKSGEVTVSNLKPNTEYEFRCRPVTSAGVGPAISVTVTTPQLNSLE